MAAPHPLLVDVAAGRAVDPGRVTDAVVDSAVEHRVFTLLLSAVDPTQLPSQVRVRLEALDMRLVAFQRGLTAAAKVAHERLADAGVEHLFFKGLIEGYRTFTAPHLRPHTDMDLALAPGASLTEAIGVLAPDHPHLGDLDGLVSGGYVAAETVSLDGFSIDVHVDPLKVGARPRHPDLWWEHTVVVDLPGVGRVRALDREASMVVFLLHQARDRFRFLLGGAEFKLRSSGPLDWEVVRALAESEGVWDQVSVAAEVMAAMLDLTPPVRPPRTIRAQLWRRLWGPNVRLAGIDSRKRHKRRGVWLMPLLARGRTAESLWWILRSAVPPDTLLRMKHPNASGPYLWRVVATRISWFGRGGQADTSHRSLDRSHVDS